MTLLLEPPKKEKRAHPKMELFVQKLKEMPEVRPIHRKSYSKKLEAHLNRTVAEKLLEEQC